MDSQDTPKPNPFSQLMNIKTKKKKRKVSDSPLAVAARNKNITLGRLCALKGTAIQLVNVMPDQYCKDRLRGLIRDIDHIKTMAEITLNSQLEEVRSNNPKV